jgi:hypothetical protein
MFPAPNQLGRLVLIYSQIFSEETNHTNCHASAPRGQAGTEQHPVQEYKTSCNDENEGCRETAENFQGSINNQGSKVCKISHKFVIVDL